MTRKILIADHARGVRSLVSYALGTAGLCGYSLLEAEDGAKALEMARAEEPELIICDIGLPRLGGIALARALNEDPTLRGTPIFLLTGDPAARGDLQAQGTGVTRWFVKPFVPERLLAAVHDVLRT